MLRIHSTVLKHHTGDSVCCFRDVSVVIASGKRPVPFRTRKLSLTAPMVLQPKGCGRVGHRRTYFEKGPGPGRDHESPGPGPFSIPRPTSPTPNHANSARITRVTAPITLVTGPVTRILPRITRAPARA